jgi:hypothetical protein
MKKPIKVDALTGKLLDEWVLRADGFTPDSKGSPWWSRASDKAMHSLPAFNPTDIEAEAGAEQCVELITRHWIGIERPSRGQTPPMWRALCDVPADVTPRPMNMVVDAYGEIMPVAAMRAFVKSRFDDTVGGAS